MNIEERMARMERSNRRLKILISLLLIGVGAVLLMGVKKGKPSDEIVAKSIRLMGTDGVSNILITGKKMRVFNQDNEAVLHLETINGSGILFAKEGKAFIKIRKKLDEPSILKSQKAGKKN